MKPSVLTWGVCGTHERGFRFLDGSKTKPTSFGTAAIYCKKPARTADIPISTPIPTATNPCTGTQPDQHGNKYSLKNTHKKDKLCI